MYAFSVFGRPPRTSACDCQRESAPALPQTLYRMTDPAVLQKLAAPTNRLGQLPKAKKADGEILEELFLACLGRPPGAAEAEAFAAHRRREPNRQAAFQDTLWALINTREFILNH